MILKNVSIALPGKASSRPTPVGIAGEELIIICLQKDWFLHKASYLLYSSLWNIHSARWNIRSGWRNVRSSRRNIKQI